MVSAFSPQAAISWPGSYHQPGRLFLCQHPLIFQLGHLTTDNLADQSVIGVRRCSSVIYSSGGPARILHKYPMTPRLISSLLSSLHSPSDFPIFVNHTNVNSTLTLVLQIQHVIRNGWATFQSSGKAVNLMYHPGYALWLVPSEPEYGALQRLMKFRPQNSSSRTQAHSSRSYPHFEPHITLATFSSAPPLPLPELLLHIETTPVYFESIKVGSSYLSSLSIVISKSPELVNLRDYIVGHLKEAHRIHAASRSFPHMSLFYLDETVRGERSRLADILRTSGRVVEQRHHKGVELNCTLDGAAPEFDAMTGFVGSEVWLVDCKGAVTDWKVLEKRKLVQRGSRIPMGSPFSYRPSPVVPVVPDHPGLSGFMPPAPYVRRTDPFFYKPNPVPVIPVPYQPPESR